MQIYKQKLRPYFEEKGEKITMFLNNTHILFYVLFTILGLISGQITSWCIKRMPEHKKVLSKDFFKEFKPNYLLMIITAIMYLILVYMYGVKTQILNNIELIKFTILTPMLIIALVVDYKYQIIPNRLNMTIFEIGLIFAFVSGLFSMNLMTNALLGMLFGGGVFLIITLIGGLIAGKEAMGFGDVKLMGALGLVFGFTKIIIVAVLAFLLAAIISIILMITRIKKSNEYIPFGPFIILAVFMVLFIPSNLLIYALIKIFTLGTYRE